MKHGVIDPAIWEIEERTRFKTKLLPDLTTGCLLWTGKPAPNGYGQARHKRVIYSVHRIAAYYAGLLTEKELTDCIGRTALRERSDFICHRCDKKLCVEPSHLFKGSHQDNMEDMRAKGRSKVPHGEGHHKSMLTDVDVLMIRGLAAAGLGLTTIAKMHRQYNYDVIRNAVVGATWKHLPMGAKPPRSPNPPQPSKPKPPKPPRKTWRHTEEWLAKDAARREELQRYSLWRI